MVQSPTTASTNPPVWFFGWPCCIKSTRLGVKDSFVLALPLASAVTLAEASHIFKPHLQNGHENAVPVLPLSPMSRPSPWL